MLHQSGFGISHVAKAAEFSLSKKFPRFPQLPRPALQQQQAAAKTNGTQPPLHATTTTSSLSALAPNSVIVYASKDTGAVDLFYSGSCHLGRIPLESSVLAACVAPSASSTSLGLFCTSGKELLYQEIETSLASPATDMLARAATATHSYLSHIHEALAEPLALFQDALDVGSRWRNKVSVTAEDHDSASTCHFDPNFWGWLGSEPLIIVTVSISPEHQLMLMMLDGKHTPAMLEVFTNKLAERVCPGRLVLLTLHHMPYFAEHCVALFLALVPMGDSGQTADGSIQISSLPSYRSCR